MPMRNRFRIIGSPEALRHAPWTGNTATEGENAWGSVSVANFRRIGKPARLRPFKAERQVRD